jgi:hypothetical protein
MVVSKLMGVKTYLLLVLSLNAGLMAAQTGPKELDSARFREQVIDQWWSCEGEESKKNCDMQLLVIKPDGIEMNCINWSNGFSGLKCKYGIKLEDNFFELSVKEYPNSFHAKFIYGYLTEGGQLFVLASEKNVALSPSLLSEKGWLKFEKIKR